MAGNAFFQEGSRRLIREQVIAHLRKHERGATPPALAIATGASLDDVCPVLSELFHEGIIFTPAGWCGIDEHDNEWNAAVLVELEPGLAERAVARLAA